jgi:hypothetical protein
MGPVHGGGIGTLANARPDENCQGLVQETYGYLVQDLGLEVRSPAPAAR